MTEKNCGYHHEGEQFQGKFDEWYDYADYADNPDGSLISSEITL